MKSTGIQRQLIVAPNFFRSGRWKINTSPCNQNATGLKSLSAQNPHAVRSGISDFNNHRFQPVIEKPQPSFL